jgi:hypothetical protein
VQGGDDADAEDSGSDCVGPPEGKKSHGRWEGMRTAVSPICGNLAADETP